MSAFNRRDGKAFDALLADDAEVMPMRSTLEGTIYRGADAGTQYCAAVEESWADLEWEVEEMRADSDWVLALGRIRGQGRVSGAGIDVEAAWVARFRDGLITSFRTWTNRTEALRAVGLE